MRPGPADDLDQDCIYVVFWLSGDGQHRYDTLEQAIKAIRHRPDRRCELTIINWRTGLAQKMQFEEQS